MPNDIDRLRERVAQGEYGRVRGLLRRAAYDARRGALDDAREFLKIAAELQTHLDGVAREECSRYIKQMEGYLRARESKPLQGPPRLDWKYNRLVRALGGLLGSGERLIVVVPCRGVGIDEQRNRSAEPRRRIPKGSNVDHVALTSSRLLMFDSRPEETMLLDEFALDDLSYARSKTRSWPESASTCELVFEARGSSLRIVVEESVASGRLAVMAATLRSRAPVSDELGAPRVFVPIGTVEESIWTDVIERDTRAMDQLRNALGDREQLVAYAAASTITYMPARHLDQSVANAIAVTNSRVLILKREKGGLLLLDAVPVREAEVVEFVQEKRSVRWTCLLRLRSRTVSVIVGRPYRSRLAMALDRLPSSGSLPAAQATRLQELAMPATSHTTGRDGRNLARRARAVSKAGYVILVAGVVAVWFGAPELGVEAQVWALIAGGFLIAIGIALILVTRRRVHRAVDQVLGPGRDESGLAKPDS